MPLSSARVFDYSDDAAVAKLLADEAKASSTRYASEGLSALLPRRTTGSAPKPNTRFLKNLVRDADQHNAALRRKEDRERVERLRNGGLKSRKDSRDANRSRTERGHDHHRSSKRRKLDSSHEGRLDDPHDHEHHGSRPRERSRSRSRSQSRSRSNDGTREKSRHRHRSHRRDERSRERNGEDHELQEKSSHRKHRRRRSRSQPHDEGGGHSARKPHPTRRRSSSDPLEDILGPLPPSKDKASPIRYRGRGAHKLASTTNIDDHFSSRYDPSLDVQPAAEDLDESEDWDMALEALRDRQAWQKTHKERMIAAGFDDEEIKKWEDSGREKDIRDVKWRERGQTREWDVGKVDQDSSEVDESREGRLTP